MYFVVCISCHFVQSVALYFSIGSFYQLLGKARDIFFYYFQKIDNLQFFKGMFGNIPCLWKTWIFPSLDEKPEKNHVWMCSGEMEMRTVRM